MWEISGRNCDTVEKVEEKFIFIRWKQNQKINSSTHFPTQLEHERAYCLHKYTKKHHALPVILIFTSPQSYFSRCYNMSVPHATLALYSKHTVGGDVAAWERYSEKAPEQKRASKVSFSTWITSSSLFFFLACLYKKFNWVVFLLSYLILVERPSAFQRCATQPLCSSRSISGWVGDDCVTVRVNCAVSVARRSCWQLQTGGKPCNNITLELRQWVFVRKWVHTCSVRIFTLNDSVRLNSASFSWYLLI